MGLTFDRIGAAIWDQTEHVQYSFDKSTDWKTVFVIVSATKSQITVGIGARTGKCTRDQAKALTVVQSCLSLVTSNARILVSTCSHLWHSA